MAESGKTLKLWKAFAWSLALHGALVAPWVLGGWWKPDPPTEQQLELDLFGMVSTRQLEARETPAETAPENVPPPIAPEKAPPPELAPAQTTPPTPPQQPPPPPAPSPVEVPASQLVQEQEQSEAATSPQSTPAETVTNADDVKQRQQSTNTPEQSDALRRYLAELSKAIQSRLSYPAEARKDRMIGAPVVQFHLDEAGYIRSGSLQILRSSGYMLLDRKALEAAEASVPFAPPPRAMDVAIAVSFARTTRNP